MHAPAIQSTARIEQFIQRVNAGVSAWQEAGRLLVDLVEEEGQVILTEIQQRCPGLSFDTLELFLSIGRREIYPLLACDDSKGAEYLAGLPYDIQETLYRDGVTVVDEGGESVVPVGKLTSWECRQVFDENKVRTPREQRAWRAEEERNRILRARDRASRKTRHIDTGSSAKGWEPDAYVIKSPVSLDELKAATPLQLLKLALDQAHSAMMDARRHLEKMKTGAREDGLVTTTLNTIGQLRFAVNSGEIQPKVA